jgi:hypothetical protein
LVESLGTGQNTKSFASIINNRILPYSQVKIARLDRKQILWAFFVVRAVISRTELQTRYKTLDL